MQSEVRSLPKWAAAQSRAFIPVFTLGLCSTDAVVRGFAIFANKFKPPRQ